MFIVTGATEDSLAPQERNVLVGMVQNLNRHSAPTGLRKSKVDSGSINISSLTGLRTSKSRRGRLIRFVPGVRANDF